MLTPNRRSRACMHSNGCRLLSWVLGGCERYWERPTCSAAAVPHHRRLPVCLPAPSPQQQVASLASIHWRTSDHSAAACSSILALLLLRHTTSRRQACAMKGCPFMAAAAAPPSDAPAAAASGCPAMAAMAAAQQQASPAPAGVCPLGFGSARGPRLSSLHCTICSGLLHAPVVTAGCRHTFCDACIARTRDCPVCGADVGATEPNAELAGALAGCCSRVTSSSSRACAAPTHCCLLPPGPPLLCSALPTHQQASCRRFWRPTASRQSWWQHR